MEGFYEKKWCKNCSGKLQKWGKNRDGSQRYFCKHCKQTNTRKRSDLTQKYKKTLFSNWLLGKLSKDEIASKYGVSRKTLTNWFKSFWNDEPFPKQLNIANKVVIIDGKYIARNGCVLIATCSSKVSNWHFSQRENYSSWSMFFNSFKYIPSAIVCDGQKGMLKAIRERFPGVIIQRCQFHVIKYIRSKLTKNPESTAAQELKSLVIKISKVKTKEDLSIWLGEYKYWWKTHREFVKEKTYNYEHLTPTGKPSWSYTHKNLHASHSHLKNSLPYLFSYLRYPQIPNTTNFVEGGVNSQIQEKLRFHRGLILSKRRILIAYYLSSKQ